MEALHNYHYRRVPGVCARPDGVLEPGVHPLALEVAQGILRLEGVVDKDSPGELIVLGRGDIVIHFRGLNVIRVVNLASAEAGHLAARRRGVKAATGGRPPHLRTLAGDIDIGIEAAVEIGRQDLKDIAGVVEGEVVRVGEVEEPALGVAGKTLRDEGLDDELRL